jgi:hypothetical protein
MRLMRLPLSTFAAYFALTLPLGCSAEEPQDARDDDFLVDGKSDTGGIVEGTAEAAAVLYVVNTSSRAVLGNDVDLANNAADNIVAVRDGDDGAAGTADDAEFATLAQLDAVPFVGPVAFGKLLAYAIANDIVGDVPVATSDPFASDPCPGAPITAAEAVAARGTIGSYQMVVRTRTCTRNDPQGSYTCGAWSPKDLGWIGWGVYATGAVQLIQQDPTTDLTQLELVNQTCGSLSSQRTVGTSCRGVGQPELACFTYHSCSDSITTYGDTVTLQGKLTNSCLALTSNGMRSDDSWNYSLQRYQHTEAQVGLLTHW